eukprot:CAMPEP_0201563694 /NCGR_PEP_ID=MMETSP0190_2-20130828/920_1 /ASSEMBLY_ACC=CAM_ASM_000263 /TAXON_ID=37353 /ORGANISM="Rosalina sp." /LENGTH=147 /DNA_ID=CAMNT_0047978803 /DNA_START=175 /DNA_END=615 /DNA_ORIENTATION=-
MKSVVASLLTIYIATNGQTIPPPPEPPVPALISLTTRAPPDVFPNILPPGPPQDIPTFVPPPPAEPGIPLEPPPVDPVAPATTATGAVSPPPVDPTTATPVIIVDPAQIPPPVTPITIATTGTPVDPLAPVDPVILPATPISITPVD